MVEKTLVPAKKYLQTGSHIGAKFKSHGMKKYIFKNRKDKLKVLDVDTVDERIRIASRFLASFPPEKIVAVSEKEYGHRAVKEFANAINAKALTGRFVPGTFTNPETNSFIEPAVLIVTDPNADRQAVKEAMKIRIPVVALCSTDNKTSNIDLIIPINNKGRKSIALAFWLLAREFLKEIKVISKDEEFKKSVEEFEFKTEESRMPKRGKIIKGGKGKSKRKSKRAF